MGKTLDDDIVEVVDEIVDDIDPTRIESEAKRLNITVDVLMTRVIAELSARLLW